VPLATIGSAPASLAGALMDEEVQDENEVPQVRVWSPWGSVFQDDGWKIGET